MNCSQVIKTALLVCVLPNLAIANEFFQFSGSVGTEGNVPRGVDSLHEIDASFLQVSGVAGKLFQLGLNDTFTVSGELSGTYYDKLSGFNSIGLSVQGELAHKFGFGAYAPRLGLILGASQQFLDGEARDARATTARLEIAKRFTPGLLLAAGLDYQDNNSPGLDPDTHIPAVGYDPELRLPLEVFDYHASAWFVEGEYGFTNGVLLQASYREIEGGTVSSTSTPNLALYKIARAFTNDPAIQPGWFAYLLDADTTEWSAGLSFPMGTDSSISLRGTWHDSDAFGGGIYKNNIVSLGYVLNF